jgi:hypothetical protein
MGFDPRRVDQMSPREYTACCESWMRAHNPDGEDPLPELSYEEFKAFMAS